MLKSSLCYYGNAYILASRTKDIPDTGTAAAPNNRKNIIVENCIPFTDWISETNNTQLDNAKDIDVVILMYNLIEYSDSYSKTTEILW